MIVRRHFILIHQAKELRFFRVTGYDVLKIVPQAFEVHHVTKLALRLLELAAVALLAFGFKDGAYPTGSVVFGAELMAIANQGDEYELPHDTISIFLTLRAFLPFFCAGLGSGCASSLRSTDRARISYLPGFKFFTVALNEIMP